MKTFKSKKLFLASSVMLALSGCGSESFTPEEKPNNSAPTHGGDINLSYHEKEALEFVNLLGTPTGASSGEGVATDADGSYLFVTDATLQTSGDKTEEIGGIGIELNGNQVGVRPYAIAPFLDNDETHTMVVSYNISDGVHTTARTATFVVTGEDVAPETTGDLIGNFTKDAGTGVLDLLNGVTDGDEEPLVVEESSIIADTENPFAVPFTVVDNMMNLDIASIESQIPDGNKVTFNYTYTIKDHNHEIERNMIINVLGVKDVPGAPLIPDYFLSSEINETDTVQVYDLAKDVIDREGDAVVVHDLTLNSAIELPYGVMVDGNTLTLDPHAYFNQVANGEFIELLFSYKISDDQGNTSDGERTLTVKLNGEQTNLLATVYPNYGFEDEAQVGPLDQATNPGNFTWGWAGWGCPEKAFQAESARTGNYGMKMRGSFCHFEIHNVIDALEEDQKYAMSYWLRNEASNGPNGNPFVPLFATVGDTGLPNKFWMGPRYFDQSLNKWMEHSQLINTNEFGNWDGYETLPMNFGILKYDESYAGGSHDLDDLNLVKFGHYDTAAHDMIVDDAGLFENSEVVTSSGGVVEIRDDAGDNKLYVNTSGEADGVTISIPVEAGAIRVGERFALSLDAQLINHDALYAENANTKVDYIVSLSNGTESIAGSSNGSTWGPGISSADIIITEEHGRSAEVDWSAEMMTLNITFTQTDAEYYINNIRVIAIP